MATGRIGTTPVLQVRWSKAPSAGTTSLSGLDDNSVSLVYSVGYEAVYRNGVLLSRGNDYTATNGTTITLIDATIAGDIIEVFANQTIPLTDTYSQTVSDGRFIKNTLTTTTGDIIYASAANTPARLGIGSTDQVLKVSGGIPAWGAAAGSMTLLSTTTLTGAATITISNISQSYTNLYILITGLQVNTGTYTLKLRPDSSDANNYSNLRGATVATSGPDYISPGNAGHSASSDVNDYALTIYNYTSTANRKPFFMVGIAKMASQVEPFGVSALGATNVTSAIDSFQLNNDSGGNFDAGTVKIYGVN